jgi:hypothetical protein
MENQTQSKTQTVDLDIKALVAEAKSKTPQEKVEEKTADDVLKQLGVKTEEATPPEVDDAEAEKLKAEEKAKEKADKAEAKKVEELKNLVGNQWKTRLNSLIEDGILEDVTITLDPGTENEKEVYLSELENLDADTYKSIVANYKEAKDKELKEKYISVEGLDDTTKKLIQLKKDGGDISQMIQQEVQVIDTLHKIEKSLDEENEQARVVFHDLINRGLSERVAKAQIQELVENFQLESTAREIIKSEIDTYELSINEKEKEQRKQLELEKEELKKFTKEVSSKYKEWGVEENLRNLLVKNTTIRDNNGLTNTDKLYFDSIKDPEKHAKIAFALNNLEAFEEFVSGKRVVEDKKKTVQSLFVLNTSNVNKGNKPSNDKTDKLIEKLKM